MNDVSTAVITSFVSAFTLFLAIAAFTSRLIKDVKGEIGNLRTELKNEIGGVRTELKSDIARLDDKFERLMFELLRHFREGGHPPPPQAA
ncbi:MAG: hypothetical protein ACRD0O_14845 [Acidimicrobiia bacterium]